MLKWSVEIWRHRSRMGCGSQQLDCLKLPKKLSHGSTHTSFMKVGSPSRAVSKEELPSVRYSGEKWLYKNDCAKKQNFIVPWRGHSITNFFASLYSDRARILCAWFITLGLRESTTSPDSGEADFVVPQCSFYSAPSQLGFVFFSLLETVTAAGEAEMTWKYGP